MSKNWYAVITADILYDDTLTARQKLLMAVISNMANDKGYCFASNAKLAELMGVSISSIQRDISKLEEKYLGRVINLKPNGEVDYRALTPIAKLNPPPQVTPPHSTHATTPHSTHDHIITNLSNNKINKKLFVDFRNQYLSLTGLTDSNDNMNTCKNEWGKLDETEMNLAYNNLSQFIADRKRQQFSQHGKAEAVYYPRSNRYLKDKLFSDVKQKESLKCIETETGVRYFKDNNNKRYSQDKVYFDKDDKKWYVV
ncbi:MAG: hypothetical protein Unbinned4388contig1000_37 [Prokaryotic dsDNA virus sp.]|nr:MAG: hypothetical protein Unbinned4388contig1000_37 [Prokaryotic dsDNA virus sp.]|tara:strand:- start:58717 stop:59481 length:765 start_codon:yes stop_codon:yes gene_type:complete